jgi:hypothetical protein
MKLKTRNLVTAVMLTAVSFSIANAQRVNRPAAYRSFEPGEELLFDAELSRSLLRRLDVADFRLKAQRATLASVGESSPASTKGETLLLTCDISSKGFFPRLFGLRFRETLESRVDPNSLAIQNSKRTDEHGKRMRSSEAVFDHVHGKVSWTERDPNDPKREPRVVTSEYSGPVHDILSAIYFLRTQPLQVGKSFDLPISDSGVVYKVPVRVLEKRRMKTVVGRVDALLIEADLFGQSGMIDGDGKFYMWLTDDARRIPVSVKVKSEYGTFDIRLKKFTHSNAVQQYLTQQ